MSFGHPGYPHCQGEGDGGKQTLRYIGDKQPDKKDQGLDEGKTGHQPAQKEKEQAQAAG